MIVISQILVLVQERGIKLVAKDILQVEVHKKRAAVLDQAAVLLQLRGKIEALQHSVEEQLILSKVTFAYEHDYSLQNRHCVTFELKLTCKGNIFALSRFNLCYSVLGIIELLKVHKPQYDGGRS